MRAEGLVGVVKIDEQAVDIDGLFGDLATAGVDGCEQEKIVAQSGEAGALPVDEGEMLFGWLGEAFLRKTLGVGHDHSERRFELVGGGGDKFFLTTLHGFCWRKSAAQEQMRCAHDQHQSGAPAEERAWKRWRDQRPEGGRFLREQKGILRAVARDDGRLRELIALAVLCDTDNAALGVRWLTICERCRADALCGVMRERWHIDSAAFVEDCAVVCGEQAGDVHFARVIGEQLRGIVDGFFELAGEQKAHALEIGHFGFALHGDAALEKNGEEQCHREHQHTAGNAQESAAEGVKHDAAPPADSRCHRRW